MAMFRKKSAIVEALTFEELVAYALASNSVTILGGVPQSFTYKGQHITIENNDCYLVPTLEGVMKFKRGNMIVTGVKGEIYPCRADVFQESFDLIKEDPKP